VVCVRSQVGAPLTNVRHELRRLAAGLLLLAAAGCAEGVGNGGPQAAATAPLPPPGFTADTFSRAGLMSGAAATEAGCRALPDGLWVDIGTRRECLRFAAAGTERGPPARTALVYIPGDAAGAAYVFAGGRPYVEGASDRYELSAEARRSAAAELSGAMGGVPVVLIGRPGMHGSSGDHARDKHTWAEVALVDAALTQLRRRYGFQDFVLSGFSSGGAIAANLLARRTDVRCAVIGSAPLDLAAFYRGQDGVVPDHYAMRRADFADPLRTVRATRSDATVVVLGDRRDRRVPASAWDAWVAAARRAGLRVFAAAAAGFDPSERGGAANGYHETSGRGMEVAHACAAGVPAERLRQALHSGEPVLAAHSRPPDGAQIRTAFAGRMLRAVE
jgi:dienelactone hydrolase